MLIGGEIMLSAVYLRVIIKSACEDGQCKTPLMMVACEPGDLTDFQVLKV